MYPNIKVHVPDLNKFISYIYNYPNISANSNIKVVTGTKILLDKNIECENKLISLVNVWEKIVSKDIIQELIMFDLLINI